MVGKFILGAIFGGVVVTGGLVIGAALFPPPHGTDAANAAANANASPAASTPIEAPDPAAAPEFEAATVEAAPEPAAAGVEATAEPEAAAPEPAPAVTDATPATPPVTEAAPASQETASADPSADGSPASAPAPQAPSEPAPSEPTSAEPPASETLLAEIAPPEPPEPALPGAVTLAETPPAESAEPELAELLPEPQPPAADPEAPASNPEPEPDATGLPGSATVEMPGTRPAALPGTPPAPDAAEPAPATGVITGRLPRIGDAPPAEPEPEIANAAPADDRPIARFATPFENPDSKPLVAILLIDGGAPELDRAGLAALPFPVSFALDPLDPATPDHAAIYRAAGREVVMLATGLPQGAQPSDVEVAFQSMAQNLPEAVAVMDLAAGGFQNDRPLASLVVPVIQGQGRGLVTWDAGLNAADPVARRADLAATTIFRDLAAGGTDRFALRRTLERVLFKAGQEGRVAVATEATPELVAGLLEWTIEGRGATVALAPLTAVLTVD